MDKSKVVKEAVEKAERDAPDAGLAGRHPRVVVVTRTGDIVCGLPRMSAPEDVASGDAEFARADFLAAALSRAVDAAYDAGKAEAHARAAREETATLAALADANEWEVRAKAAEERAGRAEAALRDIVDNGGDRGGRIAAEALAGLKGDAREKRYLPWTEAGGPNECAHRYAEGIPCPGCDKVKEDAAGGGS